MHSRPTRYFRHQSVLDYLSGMGERFADSAAAFEREAGVAKSLDGAHWDHYSGHLSSSLDSKLLTLLVLRRWQASTPGCWRRSGRR